MHFRTHDSGLHYYDPEDEDFLFLNTVSVNKESYSKQHIKDDKKSCGMYVSIGYPPVK